MTIKILMMIFLGLLATADPHKHYRNRSIPCYNAMCYTLYEEQKPWRESMELCRTLQPGGRLAAPTTDAAQKHLSHEYVKLNPKPTHGAWIAGRQKASEFVWAGIGTDAMANISLTEIEEIGNCVFIQAFGEQVFHRDNCASRHYVLCRKDDECSIDFEGCVLWYNIQKPWFGAIEHCTENGMKLFFIRKEEYAADHIGRLQAVLRSGLMAQDAGRFWIGYEKDSWNWELDDTTSMEMTYSNWMPHKPGGTPGAQCVIISQYSSGQWDNIPCNSGTHFICTSACDCPSNMGMSTTNSPSGFTMPLAATIACIVAGALTLLVIVAIVVVIAHKRKHRINIETNIAEDTKKKKVPTATLR